MVSTCSLGPFVTLVPWLRPRILEVPGTACDVFSSGFGYRALSPLPPPLVFARFQDVPQFGSFSTGCSSSLRPRWLLCWGSLARVLFTFPWIGRKDVPLPTSPLPQQAALVSRSPGFREQFLNHGELAPFSFLPLDFPSVETF